jgi:hypothetical protein
MGVKHNGENYVLAGLQPNIMVFARHPASMHV